MNEQSEMLENDLILSNVNDFDLSETESELDDVEIEF